MKLMKVVFCTDGIFPLSIGGMQRHSRLLIEELAKNSSLEITVLHPHSSYIFNSPRIKEVCLASIDPERNYLSECYRYSKRVYDIIKNKPDHIVYSQGLSVWYNIGRLPNKIIINPHGLESYQARGCKNKLLAVPFRLIFNHLFSHATYIISLGGKLTEILRSNVKQELKIVQIPNAVNIPSFRRIAKPPSSPVRVLFISRFAQNKGIHILFKAIAALNTSGYEKDFVFTLGGKGPLYDYFFKNNIYPNVNILGGVSDDDIASLYASSDVFVLPTLFEGMPTVVLEAMSYCLPVIVSDVGATALLVNHENGRLVKAGSVKELVEALLWFKNLSIEERARMGGRSLQKISTSFTWEHVANEHANLFQESQ